MDALLLSLLMAAPQPPPCNKANAGMVWTRVDGACSEQRVCSARGYRFRWQPVTVHISQLAKKPSERKPCDARADQAAGR